MKTEALLFLSLTLASANLSAEVGLAHGSGAIKEAYTGQAPPKVSSEVPEELKGVTIEEKIGKSLDLSVLVTTEQGQTVPLSRFFKDHRPVILSPIYFSCPGLCNFHLNGLTETLKSVDWSPAKQFEIIAFSFDASETSDVAAKKKENYLKLYDRAGAESGWHFVTADEATVKKITETLGFRFRWNEQAGEWSHASAAIVISPEGKISRYLHGIQFDARDVKLALNEAANGRVGNIVDSVMLYCFKYDSHQSKYGLQVFNLMKVAGAITAVAMLLWLLPVMIRARRENT